MSKSILAWYFSGTDKRLRYDDGREIAIGIRHTVKGKPDLCNHGLHASVRLIDALGYAPGPVLWRVRISGTIKQGEDKICGTVRTYLAGGVDISDILRAFARRVALDVAHLWDMPEIVRKYLETGDKNIRSVASDAASDAARAAAGAAAWAAAGAAWAAAWEKYSQWLEEMVQEAIK